MEKRASLAGHYTTVGDTECLDIICQWLDEISMPYDIAPFFDKVTNRMPGTLSLNQLDASKYTHLVMICGPVWEAQLKKLKFPLERFGHCIRVGINLTMVTPVEQWNPFDTLLERDSDRLARPDLSLYSPPSLLKVVGRCLVKQQSSYRGREHHDEARQCIDKLIQRHGFAVIDIDTDWTAQDNPIQSSEQLISILNRIDMLVTNRLHGLVFAMKAGIPALAFDAIKGTAKVTLQAQALDWPGCVSIDDASEDRIDQMVKWCLSEEAKQCAQSRREHVLPSLENLKTDFVEAMKHIKAETPNSNQAKNTRSRWLNLFHP